MGERWRDGVREWVGGLRVGWLWEQGREGEDRIRWSRWVLGEGGDADVFVESNQWQVPLLDYKCQDAPQVSLPFSLSLFYYFSSFYD